MKQKNKTKCYCSIKMDVNMEENIYFVNDW